MEKPQLLKLKPYNKTTTIITQILANKNCGMEKNLNLWKFRPYNKDHTTIETIINKSMKWRKTPTCEMSKLAINTISITIETITNKGYVMKINPNLWKLRPYNKNHNNCNKNHNK